MWNIKIENRVKREKILEDNVKKSCVMIFKEFCSSQMQILIKKHPKHDSILNCHLKIMYTISQSMQEPIQETYPHLSLT